MILTIAIIIGIAALVSIIARIIKQPPIIAYLITGVLVGPLVFNILNPANASTEIIQLFSHLGIAFLLFIAGLSLDLRVLKEIGGVASIAGIAEIILTGSIGALIALAIGFSSIAALYIGTALAFSSTVVVVKILSDKKELDTLHGRIAIGILIVEDFIAALALMIIPTINQQQEMMSIVKEILTILILITLLFVLVSWIFKQVLPYLARNQEVFFLFGIAWALSLAALFQQLGFSLEIGALIAGMTLASSKYTLELGGKIKPLRDFFIVLFFVFFGSQLATSVSVSLFKQALLFSAFVLIGKPLLVMTVLKLLGYKKRTNFLTGSSLAQISEFSLIIILLGYTLGHIPQEIMTLGVLIAILTIGVSSYTIYYAHSIFNVIGRFLNIFEGKKHERRILEEEQFDVVLFGYNRSGFSIVETLKKIKAKFIVVDYNPSVIVSLSKKGINCMYGDAADIEFVQELKLHKAALIISTIPDESSNLTIKKRLEESGSKATFIATAEQPQIALDLYQQGVDYVIVPHMLSGQYLSALLEKYKIEKEPYKKCGLKDSQELKKRLNTKA